MKRIILVCMVLILITAMTGCLPDTLPDQPEKPAGFLLGIWHGWIAPVSLIVSLFNDNVSIFEATNRGFWYEFGFYIAIIGGFGGISLVRKKSRKRDREN